jgi:predicted transcriptional regulator
MNKERDIQQLNKEWFIDAILKIKSMYKHTQHTIAENLGVTQPMISRIKGGSVKLPQAIIDKAVEIYKLDPPEYYQKEFLESSVVAEDATAYLSTIQVRYQMLESNFMDVKRELETTYNFIATLEEFNQYLKTGLNKT